MRKYILIFFVLALGFLFSDEGSRWDSPVTATGGYADSSGTARSADTANYAKGGTSGSSANADSLGHVIATGYLRNIQDTTTYLITDSVKGTVANFSTYRNLPDSARVSGISWFSDSSRVSKFADSSRISKFADSSRVSKFADSSRTGKFADSARVSGSSGLIDSVRVSGISWFGDSTRTSKFADSSRISKFADSSRVSKFADSSRTSKFSDSSRVSNFADSSRTSGGVFTSNADSLGHIIDTGYLRSNAQDTFTYLIGDSVKGSVANFSTYENLPAGAMTHRAIFDSINTVVDTIKRNMSVGYKNYILNDSGSMVIGYADTISGAVIFNFVTGVRNEIYGHQGTGIAQSFLLGGTRNKLLSHGVTAFANSGISGGTFNLIARSANSIINGGIGDTIIGQGSDNNVINGGKNIYITFDATLPTYTSQCVVNGGMNHWLNGTSNSVIDGGQNDTINKGVNNSFMAAATGSHIQGTGTNNVVMGINSRIDTCTGSFAFNTTIRKSDSTFGFCKQAWIRDGVDTTIIGGNYVYTKSLRGGTLLRGHGNASATSTIDTVVVVGFTASDFFVVSWNGSTDIVNGLTKWFTVDTLFVKCNVADTTKFRVEGYDYMRMK